MTFFDLERCPFCKCKQYVITVYLYGSVPYIYTFGSSSVDEPDLSNLLHRQPMVRAYCADCGQYLGNSLTGDLSSKALLYLQMY